MTARVRLAGKLVAPQTKSAMNELISKLMGQANLSEGQAQKVAQVVRGFLHEKVPAQLRGPLDSALGGGGEKGESATEKGKDLLGKLS